MMTAFASWEQNLAAAFTAILDRSVLDDTADFAAWYCCPDLSYEWFETDFDPSPLSSGEAVRAPFATMPELGSLLAGWDLFAPHWAIDPGASLFLGDDGDLVPGLESGLTGRALAAELAARSLTPAALLDSYPTVILRLHTDGSLFDALRTVTGTHRGPDHLLPLAPEHGVREGWDRRLAASVDPALADHLRNLFRTEDSARSHGAFHLGTENPAPGILPEVVAAWRFGEAQAWSAVTVAASGGVVG